MNKRLLQVLTTCSALVSATASAETLAEYVNNCKETLGIYTPLPALNCNNGLEFAPNRGGRNLERDYVGYASINDNVDLVFACRWLGSPTAPGGPFGTAASLEMLIHGRRNGSTCFFAANNPTNSISGVSTAIVPPDALGADSYWMQPAALDSFADSGDPNARLRCVGCHAAGPYIASRRITPFLARFGLLNDGHDTLADMTTSSPYRAVGSSWFNNPLDPTNQSVFKAWNSVIIAQMNDTDNNGKPDNDCSTACHSIGRRSTVNGLTMQGQSLIPPLRGDIAAVINVDANGRVIQTIMPPGAYSDYRWVNVDTPVEHQRGDTGDLELLQSLQGTSLPLSCTTPSFVQAHVVGSDVIFDTSGYYDKLRTFNLREGLTCLRAEQTGSHACLDYSTRYKCPSGTWTSWISNAVASGDDREERTRTNVVSAITNTCGSNVAPVAIQARFTIPGTTNMVVIDGPPDRLAQFDNFGLRCNNADQGIGQMCSNYVVRFVCANAPLPALSTLTTAHSDTAARQTVLTASTAVVNEGINNQYFQLNRQAQQWLIEPVTDFSNSLLWTIPVSDRSRAVRLRNQWTGFYATSNDINRGPSAQAPYFFLLNQARQPTWTTQIWIMEPIAAPFENFVRFRSAWVPPPSKSAHSKLYLTLMTTKGGDRGTQDVFVKPSELGVDGFPLDVQKWLPMGVGGPPLP
jgi:hypothetical protein